MVPPVGFLQVDCQQSRVYTLVLCVRMPCRGGKARQAGPCARVAGAGGRRGSKDRAACWLAPTLSKAPCCLLRSTISLLLAPSNLSKDSYWSRKLAADQNCCSQLPRITLTMASRCLHKACFSPLLSQSLTAAETMVNPRGSGDQIGTL